MHVLKLLNQSFVANKLSLSIDKTCYSIFGPTAEDKSKIVLKIDSMVLQQVDYCKYLGVLIDSDLTWQQHVDYIYSKIITFSGIFYKVLKFENVILCIYPFAPIVWYKNLC